MPLYSNLSKLPDDFKRGKGSSKNDKDGSTSSSRYYDRRKKDADFIVELKYEGGFDPKAK